MLGYTFFGSAIFALLAIGASHVGSAIEHAYAARYNREIYLTAKVKRKLAEDGRDLLEKVKNPEWEPVEDEPESTE